MKKRKVKVAKKRTTQKGWKLYPLVKGNSNEYLLIVGGAFLILVSVIFFF